VREHLATRYGIAICDPPFEQTDYHVVRAVLFNSGMKENAGIFQHPQGWAVMAECMLGRGDRAYEYFRAYMPSAYNEQADLREVEPYVYAQSTHGKYSRRFGKSRCPWLSGTATWSYHAPTQHILGIRPDYDGLRIDPCLPSQWGEVRVTRLFRGRRFDITIHNGPKGHGVKALRLNGEPLQGNLLPIEACADENAVEVALE
jgi:cellobiose phosphorylase